MRAGSEPTRVTLVPVQPADFEDLVAIRVEAMRESLERVGRFDSLRVRERLESRFSLEHTRHIVVGTERVGFVVVKPLADVLQLDHLYLKASAQNHGVGSVVLKQLIAESDEIGLPMRVGALRESASNRFYVRHGFRLVERGEFDNYYVRPLHGAP